MGHYNRYEFKQMVLLQEKIVRVFTNILYNTDTEHLLHKRKIKRMHQV